MKNQETRQFTALEKIKLFDLQQESDALWLKHQKVDHDLHSDEPCKDCEKLKGLLKQLKTLKGNYSIAISASGNPYLKV